MSRAPFAPHQNTPTYRLVKRATSPVVVMDRDALTAMSYYVGLSSDEVGWMGTVQKIETAPHLADIYHVTRVYMLEQAAHATTTEIDPQAIANLAMEMIQEDGNTERAESLLLWGHSHVNMGVVPSQQDDKQMQDFAAGNPPFMLRLIANKLGRVGIDVYDYTTGIAWLDVSWSLDTLAQPDPLLAEIQAELATKVRRITSPTVVGAQPSSFWGSALDKTSKNASFTSHWTDHSYDLDDSGRDFGDFRDGSDWTGNTTSVPKSGAFDPDAGPYQLTCTSVDRRIIMPNGREPTTYRDWLDIEPLADEYTNVSHYEADHDIWNTQYIAWKNRRDQPVATKTKATDAVRGPFLLRCSTVDRRVIMDDGGRPYKPQDWQDIEPIWGDYADPGQYQTDHEIWHDQYLAWCTETGTAPVTRNDHDVPPTTSDEDR